MQDMFLERISLFCRIRRRGFFRPTASRCDYTIEQKDLHDSRTDGDESITAFHGAPGIYRDASRARDDPTSVACN